MDWGFLLGLGAITLSVIGLVIYFGLRISRAAQKHAPESSLGAFVGHADGVIAVIVASVFFFAITAAILQKLGYPIAKRGRRGA